MSPKHWSSNQVSRETYFLSPRVKLKVNKHGICTYFNDLFIQKNYIIKTRGGKRNKHDFTLRGKHFAISVAVCCLMSFVFQLLHKDSVPLAVILIRHTYWSEDEGGLMKWQLTLSVILVNEFPQFSPNSLPSVAQSHPLISGPILCFLVAFLKTSPPLWLFRHLIHHLNQFNVKSSHLHLVYGLGGLWRRTKLKPTCFFTLRI